MKQKDEVIFVGREDELQQLMTFAQNAFAGAPGVAFVTGEAGIGKTFLVEEFFRQLRKEYENVVIASGQCTIQSASYLPFQVILEDLLESQKKIKVSGKKLRQVTEVVVDTIWNVGPELIGVFGIPIKVLQTIADKLGLRGKKSAVNFEIPKDLDKIKIFGWYTKVMKDISAQFPLVLFLDDLHWADDSSLNLLLHLGRELDTQRLLVIGTYRPHEAAPDSMLIHIKTTLGRYGAREFPLDPSQINPEYAKKTQQFVHDYLLAKYNTTFSETFEQLLADRTEGNALFLTEILKNLEEKGHIDNRSFVIPQLTTVIKHQDDLPEKIENVLSERLNRLERSLREILDFASVEGDEFTVQVIAKVRQLDEWTLIDELAEKLMKIHQLIEEEGDKSLPNGNYVDEFAFKHNLIREYVYGQLPQSKKRRIHIKIAECLEHLYEPAKDEIASKLAVHFYHAHVPDKAVHYCLKAAQDANRKYGVSEALYFGKIGLEALKLQASTLPEEKYTENKIQFLLELAKAEEFGGKREEGQDHIQQGISYLEDNLSLFDIVSNELCAASYAQLGKLYSKKGITNAQEAKEYLEKALDIYEQLDSKKNMAEILCQLGDVYPHIPPSEKEKTLASKAIEALERSVSLAKDIQDNEIQSRCLSLLTYKYKEKNFSHAEKCAEQALELSKVSDKPLNYSEIKALNAKAGVCRGYGKLKTGIQYLKKAIKIATQKGDTFLEADSLSDLGLDYSRYITLQEEAQNILERSIKIREEIGVQKYVPLSNLGCIYARQGKWKDAEKLFKQAIKESTGRLQSLYRYYIGWIFMLQGYYVQAEEKFLYRLKTSEKYYYSDLLACTKLALNYALMGNNTQCETYIKKAQRLFEKETRPRVKGEYFYEIAEIYRILGKFEPAKTACQESIEWFLSNAEDAEDLLYIAEARLIMGKIQVDMGKYQKAITCLDKVKVAFEICSHYALGETLLYLGKAHQGLGGTVLINQAKDYITNAIHEFQRLKLQHKEQEAKEVLNMLS